MSEEIDRKLGEIAKALQVFNTLICAPPDYDPHCTCGSLIPECPPCAAVNREARRKREVFERVAVDAIPFLLSLIDSLRARALRATEPTPEGE